MSLRWLLYSPCHVLGYPTKEKIEGYSNEEVKKKCFDDENLNYPSCYGNFQMPLHYPRYTKFDYERMEEWKVDVLLNQYGLSFKGNLDEKRGFAIGAFLWPDQY